MRLMYLQASEDQRLPENYQKLDMKHGMDLHSSQIKKICQHFDLEFLGSRTMKLQTSVV